MNLNVFHTPISINTLCLFVVLLMAMGCTKSSNVISGTFASLIGQNGSASTGSPTGPGTAPTPGPTYPPMGNQGLLSGMTPGKYTLPSGWTLAATENFENGSPSQPTDGTVVCTFGHTGSCALNAFINSDSEAVAWFSNPIPGREFYLSYYDWGAGGAVNEEYVLEHTYKFDINHNNALMFETAETITAEGVYNQTTAPIVYGSAQGYYSYYGDTSAAFPYFGATWTQWEIHFLANTPGNSDGQIQVWENGNLIISKTGANFTGPASNNVNITSGLNVEAGGWYTKNVWTSNGKFPNAGGTCSPEPTSSEAGSWQGAFNAPALNPANCYPAPPAFNRYIDDIILLER